MGQTAQLLQRVLEIGREPVELDLCGRIPSDQLTDERQPDEQRGQLLLRTIVKIALERAPLDLAGGRDASARFPQLSQ